MVTGALIMAGGRGQRLYPYTAALPKPLMPIGDKPILENIIRRLHQFGIRDVVLAVNHLAPLIEVISEEPLERPADSEVSRLLADNRKAARVLGWSPSVSLEEGLGRTVEWWRCKPGRFAWTNDAT